MEWAVATRHAPIAMVARRKLCSGQMRRVCRRLRPWYVPSRLDSVGAGRCSMIEPVEQAPVPPNAPAGRCPRPRWDHATQEAPVEQDRRLEAGVACVPSNAAGVASLRRVEEAHDCRSCAGPTHKKRSCAAADRCHGRNGSRHVQIFGTVRVFCSGGACGRSEYPCPPPARPMAAAVANDMEATLRAAEVRPRWRPAQLWLLRPRLPRQGRLSEY